MLISEGTVSDYIDNNTVTNDPFFNSLAKNGISINLYVSALIKCV